jgi:hypothetical protein
VTDVRYIKHLQKEFRDMGIRFERTNGDHIRLILPNGRKIHTSSAPSDGRAFLNLRARLRRELQGKRAEG